MPFDSDKIKFDSDIAKFDLSANLAEPWFIMGYGRMDSGFPIRYCLIEDYRTQISADGGSYSYTEVLGDRALVKVRAGEITIGRISAVGERLPAASMTANLSGLTTTQQTQLNTSLLTMGYSQGEITTALGDLTTGTMGDYLEFAASRRFRPRYDGNTDSFIFDGVADPVLPVTTINTEVP